LIDVVHVEYLAILFVDFFKTGPKIYSPVSPQTLPPENRTTRIAKDLLVLEEAAAYRLSGKTGRASLGDSSAPQIGWLVGYLERDGKVYFFATNLRHQER
jgi:beta-lactamase class D